MALSQRSPRAKRRAPDGPSNNESLDLTHDGEASQRRLSSGQTSQRFGTQEDSKLRLLQSRLFEPVIEKIQHYQDEVKLMEDNLANNITITDHELDAVTRSTLRFVLFACTSKGDRGVLAKSEVLGHINSKLAAQRKGVPALVVAKVQLAFAKAFGLDMVELTKAKKLAPGPSQASASAAQGSKYYELKSLLPREIYKDTVGKTDVGYVAAQRGLLGVIISLIKMSGGSLVEDELWRHLKSLGVDKSKTHPSFGGIPSDIVDDFCRKRYLKVDKLPGLDVEARAYSLAENAVHDVTEEMVTQAIESELVKQ